MSAEERGYREGGKGTELVVKERRQLAPRASCVKESIGVGVGVGFTAEKVARAATVALHKSWESILLFRVSVSVRESADSHCLCKLFQRDHTYQ